MSPRDKLTTCVSVDRNHLPGLCPSLLDAIPVSWQKEEKGVKVNFLAQQGQQEQQW